MANYIEVAKRLYPGEEQDSREADGFPRYGVWRYEPIIAYFGTVAVQRDDDGYQGDTNVLYAETSKGFGYLNFGWGSCSGCDALQGARSYQHVAELIEQLENSIKWLPKAEMLKFFKEHDWEGDHSWHLDEFKEFVAECIEYLEKEPQA